MRDMNREALPVGKSIGIHKGKIDMLERRSAVYRQRVGSLCKHTLNASNRGYRAALSGYRSTPEWVTEAFAR